MSVPPPSLKPALSSVILGHCSCRRRLPDFDDVESVVCIIHNDTVSLPSVDIHLLDNDGSASPQCLPGATGYCFLPSLDESIIDDKRLVKVVNKGVASLANLSSLLGGASNSSTSLVTIGQRAFISTNPLSSKSKGHDGIDTFIRLHLQLPNGAKSTQYFNPRFSGLRPSALDSAKLRQVHINSGICLFSKALLAMSSGHGHPNIDDRPVIPPLPSSVNLTLYELETITRLSCAIVDTACIVRRTCRGYETAMSINIDIPDFQYYWTACELFERSLVDISYVHSWIATIDERRKKIKAIMTGLVRTILADRQLSDLEVKVAQGTKPVVNLIKRRLASGLVPSLQDILSALRGQGGDARQWREFLGHLDSRQPATVSDLSRLAYVFHAVKAALQHQVTEETGRTLIIQVDDSSEWRILQRAKTFLKHYLSTRPNGADSSILLGLFPMQKIVVASSGRSDLYIKDPGQQLRLGLGRTMIRPLDIIGTAYGLEMKNNLQRLCRQEGLQ
ncbi:hypothetical protein HIM_11068 [Hirsutella minnesotensis 3608]|uniref:Uncharacterized protein n=1 Tax=Hirsutella minnesotensis 3608 TaxID=1043627 RepID=A0A0F7ZRF9_9HYPO|nr:hypothetical protein HIM_11068 [Hirsutella minnesotensis 3608]